MTKASEQNDTTNEKDDGEEKKKKKTRNGLRIYRKRSAICKYEGCFWMETNVLRAHGEKKVVLFF